MKNKKMLKVLSTSFILGTILITSPSFAEKVGEDLSVNENVENIKEDKDFKKETATNVISESNVITGNSNTVKEKGRQLELVNNANSEENSEKLELSSDTEKESVKADSGETDPDLYTPNYKYDEPMKIDDPETYDYAKYMLDHYKPTNEGFKEKGQQEAAMVNDGFYDENGKVIGQNVLISKGKDLSNKVDEFIVELEKGRKENKLNEEYVNGLKNKIFNINNGQNFSIARYYSDDLNTYLNLLSGMYMDTYNGDGNGHSVTDAQGNMTDSDYTFENFKKTYENLQLKNEQYVYFRISDSFKNRPIVRVNDIFLSEDQYLQDRDKILDYLKTKADFSKVVRRSTTISSGKTWNHDNSEVLPNNIRNAFSEEELKTLSENKGFDIIYDTQHINHGDKPYTKADLSKESDSNYILDKESLNANSFSLAIGHALKDIESNSLPINYYLSENDKPIYKADNKLKFKEKSDVIGSKYYISNSYNDKDEFIKSFRKVILDSSKDDEDFNKLSKEEQDRIINENIEPMVAFIEDYHKNDKENIAKYQAFLNSEKWGNQRLTQYVGNVDTKTEEKDFKVVKKEDPTLAVGESKVAKKGVKGKKVTKTTYKVNRTSGELTDPVSEIVEDTKPVDEVILVGTKKVTPATPIEDIATTTKTTKEVIKAGISYEADETLEFEKQNVAIKPINGEKEITTVSQSGKKDVVTEKVIKDKVDGLTKVGNKKVEVETKDGVTTTTTTIYEVDKETGKLVNPKVTTHKSTKIGTIEDIAKTTKTTKETIKAKVSYEADETLEFGKQKEVKKAVDGEKEITTVSQSGKKDVVTEKVIKDKVDGLTKVGNKKVEVETKDGVTTTTTTIYEVDKETGKLVNPKVTTHKSTKIGTIEDIAKTTKTTKETIKARVSYEADETLEFGKQKEVKKAVDGEKEITTVSQSGKKDVVTEKVIKDKVDGLTKVGNKKVEVETKDGVTTTTTTIYEVDKGTGKLVNPKVTTHKTTKAGIIEDIAKKTIPATKIEDIAKKTIPATKIEDIAKKTMPATKIEDIAKKTMPATKIEDIAKNTNKNDEKDNSNEPKKDSHLPKAGVNSEILTLAVGALATIGGINLSKKRRK